MRGGKRKLTMDEVKQIAELVYNLTVEECPGSTNGIAPPAKEYEKIRKICGCSECEYNNAEEIISCWEKAIIAILKEPIRKDGE